MEALLQRFFLATSFFTRLPIASSKDHKGDLADASITFPIVGFLIGALLATIWLVACYFLPVIIASGITILAGLILTGALHEDGLSDCADALGGFADKERALEIMRDSRLGTYGAAALIMTIGLRWTGLSTLDLWAGFSALIVSHMAGRAAISIALFSSNYARNKGLASSVSEGIEFNNFAITLAIALGITLLLTGLAGIIATLFAFVAAFLMLKWLEKRIGGYTGDGLGAMEQSAEITALISLATFLA